VAAVAERDPRPEHLDQPSPIVSPLALDSQEYQQAQMLADPDLNRSTRTIAKLGHAHAFEEELVIHTGNGSAVHRG
jgi:hypothetical protein